MIKLIRSFIVNGDWEKVNDGLKAQKTLFEEKYPQVKSIGLWGGVTGRVDRMYLELDFESLADEESWALAVMQDPEYIKAGEMVWNNSTEFTDNLYRKWTDPES